MFQVNIVVIRVPALDRLQQTRRQGSEYVIYACSLASIEERDVYKASIV